jgi:hypothetical protein
LNLTDLIFYYISMSLAGSQGKANQTGKKGKGGGRLPQESPAAAAASAQGSITPPSSVGDHRSNKTRRLAEQADMELDSAEVVESPADSPAPDFAGMFARILQSGDATNAKLDSMQADTNSKFEEVHYLIEAQNARIAAFTAGKDPWAASDGAGSPDPGLAARIAALETQVKDIRVDSPAASAPRWGPPGASAASGINFPPMHSFPTPQQGAHKPNVIWIKGLVTNVSSKLLKTIADRVIALIPDNLHAAPAPDIRGFGKQFIIAAKDGDAAKRVVEFFRDFPIEIQHPVGGAVVGLKAYRDKSLDLRLKDRLLGILWKKVMDLKGEGNIRLSNNRGSLWAMEDSGEVWDLFSAAADCSDRTPSFRIIPHFDHLLHYNITEDQAKAWTEEALREVNANVSRFRSGR